MNLILLSIILNYITCQYLTTLTHNPQALSVLHLDIADKAFVRCSDYSGIEFVQRLQKLDDPAKQRAELHAYFTVSSGCVDDYAVAVNDKIEYLVIFLWNKCILSRKQTPFNSTNSHYFQRFEDAERVYVDIDRRDLAINMRMKIGDWFRVVQHIKSGKYSRPPAHHGSVG